MKRSVKERRPRKAKSVKPAKPPPKPPRELVPDGSECFHCGSIAKGKAKLWLYRLNRAIGKRERYKRHPKPKRYFSCQCGRTWSRLIPKSQIRRKIPPVDGAIFA